MSEPLRQALAYGGAPGHTLQVKTMANPAAGADYANVTVPGGELWVVWSITAALTCSAAAATRLPRVFIDDGANVIGSWAHGNTAPASSTTRYTWSQATNTAIIAGVGAYNTHLPLLVLQPGWRIRFSSGALGAADQWSLGVILVDDTLIQTQQTVAYDALEAL